MIEYDKDNSQDSNQILLNDKYMYQQVLSCALGANMLSISVLLNFASIEILLVYIQQYGPMN